MIYLFFIAAYLLGSVPFALIVARAAKGIDIREHGSKNIGTTNAFRVLGKKWGFLVFFLDAFKGFLAVLFPKIFVTQEIAALAALGFLAILGHAFPVWLSFKGGKGVATSLGVFLGIAPLATLLAFAVWIIVFLASHIVSLASLAAASAFPLMIFFTYKTLPGFEWLIGIGLLLTLFIFYTHRSNLARLTRGEEKKLF